MKDGCSRPRGPAFVSQRPSGTQDGGTAGVRAHRLFFISAERQSHCLEMTGGLGAA